MTAMRRPVLRYQGGKFRIAQWVISHFPPHLFYAEPFGGSASVLLAKDRSNGELYNDLDGNIVNVFRVMRDKEKAQELAYRLRFTPYAHDELDLAMDERICEDDIETARRTIIRAYIGSGADGATRSGRTGFGGKITQLGICANCKAWPNYPAMIEDFCARLQGVIIENRAASHVIKTYNRPETLFYVDPPYARSTWNQSKSYKKELTDVEHEALLMQLCNLSSMVVLSGYNCDMYQDMLTDWHVEKRENINQLNDARTEYLWINPAAWARLDRQGTLLNG